MKKAIFNLKAWVMLTLYSSYEELMDSLDGMVRLTRENMRNGIDEKAECNELYDMIYAFRCIFPICIPDENFKKCVKEILDLGVLTIQRGGNYDFEVEEGLPLNSIIVENDLNSLTAAVKEITIHNSKIKNLKLSCESFFFYHSNIKELEITNSFHALQKFVGEGNIYSSFNSIAPLPNSLHTFNCASDDECVKDWRIVDWHSQNLKDVTISIQDYWRWGEEWWNHIRNNVNLNLTISMWFYDSVGGDVWDDYYVFPKIKRDNDYWEVMRELLLFIYKYPLTNYETEQYAAQPSSYLNWWEEYKSNPHELDDNKYEDLRNWITPPTDNPSAHIDNVLIPIFQELNLYPNRGITADVLFVPILIG